jgi:hypothetical protein
MKFLNCYDYDEFVFAPKKLKKRISDKLMEFESKYILFELDNYVLRLYLPSGSCLEAIITKHVICKVLDVHILKIGDC